MLATLLPIFAAAAADASAPADSSALHLVQQVFGPFGVKPNLLLAQIINFCIVAFVVYRFGVKPVVATVDERNKKIADGLKYTEDMKKKLADAEKQHAEVLKQAAMQAQQIIAESRETGKALIEKASQEAARHAEDIMKKGEQAVSLERQKMLADLKREVAALVIATTQRVLARDLSPEERNRFTSTAAENLSKN